jgi:hypothetical protein
MNAEGTKYIDFYLGSDVEFDRFLYHRTYKSKHKDRINVGYKRFTEMYIEQFYPNNKEKGKKLCYHYEFKIKNWLAKKIEEIVDIKDNGRKYRKMYGYKLISDGWEEINDATGRWTAVRTPPLLQRFFFYIYHKDPNNRRLTFQEMFKEKTWIQFLNDEMKTSVGLIDFYEIDWIKNCDK